MSNLAASLRDIAAQLRQAVQQATKPDHLFARAVDPTLKACQIVFDAVGDAETDLGQAIRFFGGATPESMKDDKTAMHLWRAVLVPYAKSNMTKHFAVRELADSTRQQKEGFADYSLGGDFTGAGDLFKRNAKGEIIGKDGEPTKAVKTMNGKIVLGKNGKPIPVDGRTVVGKDGKPIPVSKAMLKRFAAGEGSVRTEPDSISDYWDAATDLENLRMQVGDSAHACEAYAELLAEELPPAVPIRIDGRTVYVNGEAVPLGMTPERTDDAIAFLSHLLASPGNWFASADIDRDTRRIIVRKDRLAKSLPDQIKAHIQSKHGTGYRIALT